VTLLRPCLGRRTLERAERATPGARSGPLAAHQAREPAALPAAGPSAGARRQPRTRLAGKPPTARPPAQDWWPSQGAALRAAAARGRPPTRALGKQGPAVTPRPLASALAGAGRLRGPLAALDVRRVAAPRRARMRGPPCARAATAARAG